MPTKQQLEEARQKLQQQLAEVNKAIGRPPTQNELAAAVGISARQLRSYFAQGCPRTSIDAVKDWIAKNVSSPAPSPAGEVQTTAAAAAQALGVSRKTFDQWKLREGFPGRPGHFPIEEIRQWRATNIPAPTNDPGTGDLAARMQEARLTTAETKAAREVIRLGFELDNLISVEDSRFTLERTIATVKAIFGEIADRLEPRLPAKLPRKIKDELRSVINQANDEAFAQLEEMLRADADDEEEADEDDDSDESS